MTVPALEEVKDWENCQPLHHMCSHDHPIDIRPAYHTTVYSGPIILGFISTCRGRDQVVLLTRSGIACGDDLHWLA